MIRTWRERMEDFDDVEAYTNANIYQMMQKEIDELRQELALQKLSDIGQAIEKPVGSNWWKGDPTCGGIAENYMSKETSDKC